MQTEASETGSMLCSLSTLCQEQPSYDTTTTCTLLASTKSPPALNIHKDIRLEFADPNRLPRPFQLVVPLPEPLGDDIVDLFLPRGLLARRFGVVVDALLRCSHDAREPLLQSALVHVVL